MNMMEKVEDLRYCIAKAQMNNPNIPERIAELGTFAANSCQSCGNRFNPIFMVHDELWQQSGIGSGYPCILCFEKAIGRRLRIEDLKPTPLCNHMLDLSWFLGNRAFGNLPSAEDIFPQPK
jgi:hypothetical protein